MKQSTVNFLPTQTPYQDSPAWHNRVGDIAKAGAALYRNFRTQQSGVDGPRSGVSAAFVVDQIEGNEEDAGGGKGSNWQLTIYLGDTALSLTPFLDPDPNDTKTLGQVAEELMNTTFEDSVWSDADAAADAAHQPRPTRGGAFNPPAMMQRPLPDWAALPSDVGDPDWLARSYRTPDEIAFRKAVLGLQ